MNYKKEKYLNEAINNYIKNDKDSIEKKATDSSESLTNRNLREKLDFLIQIKKSEIERDIQKTKKYFKNLLYDEIISKKNYREIEVNKNLLQLQVKIYFKFMIRS